MAIGIDENQILTQSIGEHAVTAVGREHLKQLTVTFDSRDANCTIAVVLRDDSDAEQLRAIDKLLDVKILFLDEAIIDLRIDDECDEPEANPAIGKRQYSYA